MNENIPNANAQTKDKKPLEKTLRTISAPALMKLELPPVHFVVNKLLPQGLAILASQPKVGKSWLSLDLCLSVASGMPFLNRKTNKCGTLYLALEDSASRLQERIKKVWGDKPLPELCKLAIDSHKLFDGLVEELENFIKDNPTTKLIVIDTLQKVRGNAKRNETPYGFDYSELGQIKKFADRKHICILLIHHLKKMKDETDAFAQISGTNGISGSVDTMLVLAKEKRTSTETVLSMTGRDIEQNEEIIEFDKETCRWRSIGNTEDVAARKELKEYQNNCIVRTIKRLLNVNNGVWQGTAADLLSACKEYAGEYVPENLVPATLSKVIKKVQNLLYENDGISYKPPNPNGGEGGRMHTFTAKYINV